MVGNNISIEAIPISKKRRTNKQSSLPPRTIAPFKNGQPETILLYPLSNYAFKPRVVKEFRDHEAKEDEIVRNNAKGNNYNYRRKNYKNPNIPMNNIYFKNLKNYNDKYGTRRYLQFLIIASSDNIPIIMLFKDKNNQFIIPGGYLNHDEDETKGGERLLKELFDDDDDDDEEQESLRIGEVVGRWWRTDLKQNVYPYLPRHVTNPKELIKTVLIKLPKRRKLSFPEFYKNFYPYNLIDLYDENEPELKSIPLFLSRFTFNYIKDDGVITKEITDESYTLNS